MNAANDHDREQELFGKRYDLKRPWPAIVAIAFNEGWLRGREALRVKLRKTQKRRKPK